MAEVVDAIQITDDALKRVNYLIKQEGNDNLKFRVYITGGGCSGFQYGFSFEEMIQEDDLIVEKQITDGDETATIMIIVDPLSMTYLDGAVVSYTEGLYGSHFSIKNPNAQTTCGCGSSFSV